MDDDAKAQLFRDLGFVVGAALMAAPNSDIARTIATTADRLIDAVKTLVDLKR